MGSMKVIDPVPIAIPPEIAAKCDAQNQAENFDRGIRAFLTVPKSAVLKEEAKTKRRKRAKKSPVPN
jgi:hypothetical protein